jgi:hypothetical protein
MDKACGAPALAGAGTFIGHRFCSEATKLFAIHGTFNKKLNRLNSLSSLNSLNSLNSLKQASSLEMACLRVCVSSCCLCVTVTQCSGIIFIFCT